MAWDPLISSPTQNFKKMVGEYICSPVIFLFLNKKKIYIYFLLKKSVQITNLTV
jgi:hypothetical protein